MGELQEEEAFKDVIEETSDLNESERLELERKSWSTM